MKLEHLKQQKSELELQKTEAEASFDGEQVGKIDQELADLETKIKDLESKSETAGNPTEGQIKQIQDLDGDISSIERELATKTEEAKEAKEGVEEAKVIAEQGSDANTSEPEPAPEGVLNNKMEGKESSEWTRKELLEAISQDEGQLEYWKNHMNSLENMSPYELNQKISVPSRAEEVTRREMLPSYKAETQRNIDYYRESSDRLNKKLKEMK